MIIFIDEKTMTLDELMEETEEEAEDGAEDERV